MNASAFLALWLAVCGVESEGNPRAYNPDEQKETTSQEKISLF